MTMWPILLRVLLISAAAAVGEETAYKAIYLDRQLFIYSDALYTPWTDWGTCERKKCSEMRWRECRDESYHDTISQLAGSDVCPFQYVVEERRCLDSSECHFTGKQFLVQ